MQRSGKEEGEGRGLSHSVSNVNLTGGVLGQQGPHSPGSDEKALQS